MLPTKPLQNAEAKIKIDEKMRVPHAFFTGSWYNKKQFYDISKDGHSSVLITILIENSISTIISRLTPLKISPHVL